MQTCVGSHLRFHFLQTNKSSRICKHFDWFYYDEIKFKNSTEIRKLKEKQQLKKLLKSKIKKENSILNEANNKTQEEIPKINSILKTAMGKKRKSVRFEEPIQLVNENNPTENPPEKAHLIAEDYLNSENSHSLSDNIKLRKKFNSSLNHLDESLSTQDSLSNDTIILNVEEGNNTCDVTARASYFEYDSILFPKAARYVDSFSLATQDMSLAFDHEETTSSNESKEAKKEKKLITTDLTVNQTQTCYLTLMSMELHVNTRGNLTPNPDQDSIGFICYTVYNQKPQNKCLFDEDLFESHLIIYDKEKRSMATSRFLGINSVSFLRKRFKSISYVYKEEELFERIKASIQLHDPDILVGFELQKLSW